MLLGETMESVDVGEKFYISYDCTDENHMIEICRSTNLHRVKIITNQYIKDFHIPFECIQVFEMVRED